MAEKLSYTDLLNNLMFVQVNGYDWSGRMNWIYILPVVLLLKIMVMVSSLLECC